MKRSPSPIASTVIRGARPGEAPFSIAIEIGKPYRETAQNWACSVALKGLYENLADARGEDALQALCLALSLAFELLDAFRLTGGTLTYETGGAFPLESYAFGLAQRDPD